SQAAASLASLRSNSALISARSAPWRTTPASARSPMARPSASTRMDLPAPVSPVSTVMPGFSSSSSVSMMAKSRMRMCVSMSARMAPASPMEFRAQDFIVIVAAWMDEADAFVRALHPHPVAGLQCLRVLSIPGDLGAAAVGVADADLDAAAASHHQRPVAEGMGADGDQRDGVHGGVQDGPAARQGIGGGTGGRGHDHAVGAVGAEEQVVHPGLELDEPAAVGLVHHHIVERRHRVRGLSGTL